MNGLQKFVGRKVIEVIHGGKLEDIIEAVIMAMPADRTFGRLVNVRLFNLYPKGYTENQMKEAISEVYIEEYEITLAGIMEAIGYLYFVTGDGRITKNIGGSPHHQFEEICKWIKFKDGKELHFKHQHKRCKEGIARLLNYK